MEPVKAPWQSKQVILGLITSVVSIVSVFAPSVGEWFSGNMAIVGSLLGVAIILLRFISKGKISIE